LLNSDKEALVMEDFGGDSVSLAESAEKGVTEVLVILNKVFKVG
jgi:hypothetical protein